MVEDLLERTLEAGVILREDKGNLRFQGPSGAFTPELRAEVTGAKQEIIAKLKRACFKLPTEAQRMVLFRMEERGISCADHICGAMRIAGEVDWHALEQALRQLIGSHRALRSSFIRTSAGFLVREQRILPDSWSIVHTPLTEEESIDKRLQTLVDQPIDPFEEEIPLRVHRLFGRDDNALLFVFHHAFCDGYSLDLFFKKLSDLIGGVAREQVSSEVRADEEFFSLYNRRNDLDKQLDKWFEYCCSRKRCVPAHFGVNATTPYGPSAQVRRRFRRVDVAKIATRLGMTNASVLFAAFSILIRRYQGTDCWLGLPVVNRQTDISQAQIALYAQLLPVAPKVEPSNQVQDVFRAIRDQLAELMSFGEVSISKLLARISQEGIFEAAHYSDLSFQLLTGEIAPLKIPGATTELIDLVPSMTNYYMNWGVVPTGEQDYELVLEYRKDLYYQDFIENLVEDFISILAFAQKEQAGSCLQIPLVSRESKILGKRFGATRKEPLGQFNLTDRILNQVKSSPDAIAVSTDVAQYSYRQLWVKAETYAYALTGHGIKPGDRVCICEYPSFELISILLATQLCGAAYVPLDPRQASSRLQTIKEDAEPALLVGSQEALTDCFPNRCARTIDFDTLIDSISSQERVIENLNEIQRTFRTPANLSPQALSYIIYTSGTTGVPKGVQVSQQNVLRLFDSTQEWYSFGPDDVWTLYHSFAFDFSVWEIWGALLFGGRLVLVPSEDATDPAKFTDLLQRESITILNVTPSAFYSLSELLIAQEFCCDSLRLVIFGGEALDPRLLDDWFSEYGDKKPQLVNMYGITETTVHTTYSPVSHDEARKKYFQSRVGEPLPDMGIVLLNKDGVCVPWGMPGEIGVLGAGVSKGYWKRPQLNAERFTRLKLSTSPGEDETVYLSGDLGRLLPDGSLEYLGRNDRQIQRQGYRIELGEIEGTLQAVPWVSRVICELDDDRLIAFVLLRQKNNHWQKDLKHHIKAALPHQFHPEAWCLLDEVPRTTNGKVDRKKLLALIRSQELVEMEALSLNQHRGLSLFNIRTTFAQTLGRDDYGDSENFYVAGGNSMTILQLLNSLRALGLNIDLRSLLSDPSPQGVLRMSAGIVVAPDESKVENFIAYQPFEQLSETVRRLLESSHLEDAFPLTELQKGMLLESQRRKEQGVYHDIFVYELTLARSEHEWAQRIRHLVERHPVLRSTLHLEQYSEPIQCIHQRVPLPFLFHDLKELDLLDQDHKIENWRCEEREKGINTEEPPSCRFIVFDCGKKRGRASTQFLALSFHHALLDGWSVSKLLEEVLDNEENLRGKPAVPRFSELVRSERKALKSSELPKALDEMLAHSSVAVAPIDFEADEIKPARVLRTLAVSTSEEVIETSKVIGCSAKSIYLACFHLMNWLVSPYAGCREIETFALTVSHSRFAVPDSQNILGLFLNLLPSTATLTPSLSLASLALALEEQEKELARFSAYPLAGLSSVRELLRRVPVFNYVHFSSARHRDLVVKQDVEEPSELPFLLCIIREFEGRNDALELSFNETLYDRGTIERCLEIYECLLERVISQPEAAFDKRVLDEHIWKQHNIESLSSETGETFWRRFLSIAEKFPKAKAVIDSNHSMTYDELARGAALLSKEFKGLGVSAGDIVQVDYSATCEHLVALLATWCLGGTYSPIDTRYNLERSEQLVANCNAGLVVSNVQIADSVQSLSYSRVRSLIQSTDRQSADDFQITPENNNAPAVLIFTSGSTGSPKGVLLEHGSLLFHHDWLVRTFERQQVGRSLVRSSPLFDTSLSELLAPLMVGGTVCYGAPDTLFDPVAIIRDLQITQATFTCMVPSILREWLHCVSKFGPLPRLDLICGGERLPFELIEESRRFPWLRLWNFYGPAEATIDSSFENCSEGLIPGRYRSTIGAPVEGVGVIVCDDNAEELPIGCEGELVIVGPTLARGYYFDPEQTALRFKNVRTASGRSYRGYFTGDYGRYLVGTSRHCRIEFRGRKDRQVKIAGVRVELDGVESQLRDCSGVQDVAVVFLPEVPRLVAFIVSPAGEELAREACNKVRQGVPALCIQIANSLPRTASGKVDLPSLQERARALELSFEPIQDENTHIDLDSLEYRLAILWQENGAQVFREDHNLLSDQSFFELGGNSMTLIRLASRLSDEFNVQVRVMDLFKRVTIREQASWLESLGVSLLNADAAPEGEQSRDKR